jgi:hypothetical protein
LVPAVCVAGVAPGLLKVITIEPPTDADTLAGTPTNPNTMLNAVSTDIILIIDLFIEKSSHKVEFY